MIKASVSADFISLVARFLIVNFGTVRELLFRFNILLMKFMHIFISLIFVYDTFSGRCLLTEKGPSKDDGSARYLQASLQFREACFEAQVSLMQGERLHVIELSK